MGGVKGRSGRKQLTDQQLLGTYGAWVEAYEQLGTLRQVGAQVGVTRERVRQILTLMRMRGLYKYQPMCDRKECEFVRLAAQSVKTATTMREVAHDAGYGASPSSFQALLAAFGMQEAIKTRTRENRAEEAVHRLIVRCRTLPHQGHWGEAKGEGYSTTVLQAHAHAELARVQRLLGTTKKPASIAIVRARIKGCLAAGHVKE